MPRKLLISEEKIKEAIHNTSSMLQAAKFMGVPYTTFKRKATKLGLYKPNQHPIGVTKGGPPPTPIQEILDGKHPNYKSSKLKKRLVDEGIFEDKCDECSQGTEWNGKFLVLQLDHINGNSYEHFLDNLRILCPNCHTQTDTFGSRNRINDRVTDEELLETFNKVGNITETIRVLKLSKGSYNRNRIKDLLGYN